MSLCCALCNVKIRPVQTLLKPPRLDPHARTQNPSVALLLTPACLSIYGVKKIILEKLSSAPLPAFSTASWEQYDVGTLNPGVSLPNNYVIHGFLLEDMVVGRPVRVLRTIRNGVSAPGVFVSSPITALSSKTFCTENSLYRYTLV